MLYISLRRPAVSDHVRTACAAAGSVRLWRSQELDKVYEELDEKDEALTAETQRRCPDVYVRRRFGEGAHFFSSGGGEGWLVRGCFVRQCFLVCATAWKKQCHLQG